MAKKSFRSGLGSLIQDSRIEFEANGITKDERHTDTMHEKMEQLLDELRLWRTGKLTLEIFENALKENHLHYNAESNAFEKVD